ncbi:hypothetical protein SmJEL517_g02026 [Synchytrium microbalum]|uniref:Uncharacterized protein n=1 Tax=Synchytrium microbalum TaxID=1806994 RepID=A0A507C423_9FUNG|nr:uncharacterized protein SmJEL517_g02026 [Synchytrium microbalum]TPX35717.1 hypothetical protein SmJEL517_g02026 [Synchytrium microbalum]
MNLAVLESNVLPDFVEDKLEGDEFTVINLSKHGTFLATGSLKGIVQVWDFDTRQPIRSLAAHAAQVTAVSFERSGRYLLSASRDSNCIYWDLYDGSIKFQIAFNSPILWAQMHPKEKQFALSPYLENPQIVDLPDSPDAKLIRHVVKISAEPDLSTDQTISTDRVYITTGSFDRKGEYLYLGNSQGAISVLHVKSLTITTSIQISESAVKSVDLNPSRTQAAICTDSLMTVSIQHLPDKPIQLQLLRQLEQVPNQTVFTNCGYSHDGAYIYAGSAAPGQHNIYMWETETAFLIKGLEGPREDLLNVMWHPKRPTLVSVSSEKCIYVWGGDYRDAWAVVLPGFKQIDECQQYEEREDEFDIVVEAPRAPVPGNDEFVDVDTMDSDDDEYGQDMVLPILLEPDMDLEMVEAPVVRNPWLVQVAPILKNEPVIVEQPADSGDHVDKKGDLPVVEPPSRDLSHVEQEDDDNDIIDVEAF